MLFTKIPFILFSVIVFSASNIYGQPKLNVAEEVERLTKDLDLSEKQASQVEAILIDSKGQVDKLRESGVDRREMIMQMRELMDETNKEIESKLNDEQREKFREIVEKRKDQMQRRRPHQFNN